MTQYFGKDKQIDNYPPGSLIEMAKNVAEPEAINVAGECADVYYSNYQNMDKRLRRKFSTEMLRAVFDHMVIPAIEKARALDREGREST